MGRNQISPRNARTSCTRRLQASMPTFPSREQSNSSNQMRQRPLRKAVRHSECLNSQVTGSESEMKPCKWSTRRRKPIQATPPLRLRELHRIRLESLAWEHLSRNSKKSNRPLSRSDSASMALRSKSSMMGFSPEKRKTRTYSKPVSNSRSTRTARCWLQSTLMRHSIPLFLCRSTLITKAKETMVII